MKFLSFSIITALALLYAGLTAAESALYQTLDRAEQDQRVIQAKMGIFERTNDRVRQMLQRMAFDSQRDPALVKLLKENHINVVVTSPQIMNAPSTPGDATTPGSTNPHP